MEHLHVLDGGFKVNTFGRALQGVDGAVADLEQVIHFRRGRPLSGVAVPMANDGLGRSMVRVLQPVVLGDSVRLDVSTMPANDVVPHPLPLSEATSFLAALGNYQRDQSDANWLAANDALSQWDDSRRSEILPRNALAAPQPVEELQNLPGQAYHSEERLATMA